MYTVLHEIQSSLGILLSESNKQQQDLDTIKGDLRTLKFGYALLHQSHEELSEESRRQLYKLKQIERTLEEQQVDIDSITSSVQSLEDSEHPCGDRDWINILNLDMADPNQNCPRGWMLTDYSKRTCGRVSTDEDQCDTVTIPVSVPYSKVCGRIVAYQYGGTDAFRNFDENMNLLLGQPFVDGIVLSRDSFAQHIIMDICCWFKLREHKDKYATVT